MVSRNRLAAAAAAMVLLGWALMTLGAFVRASESGLGCPDWPSCHGQLLAGGHHAMIEEVHRWVASVLILGIVVIAVAVFRHHRRERSVMVPMLWLLALLAVQVVLGGITVLLKNVAWTVVIHYGAAALLVASLALLAVRLAFVAAAPPARDSFSALIGWFAALSFGLLLAGSTVANTDSHTACGRDFPLCNGSVFPPLEHHVVVNMVHRTWAGAMLVLALYVLWRSRRDRAGAPAVQRTVVVVTALYCVQAAIGVIVLAVGENTAVEILHSSVASLTWAALASLLALTRTLPAESAVTQPTARHLKTISTRIPSTASSDA